MGNLIDLIISGLLSGSVLAVIVGVLLQRARTTIEKEVEIQFTETRATIEKEVEIQFNKALEVFMSEREWREKSLSELIGPVYMHLDRTSQVAKRYKKTYKEQTTSYFDALLMRDSNEAVRSILLSKGHLLPEDLRDHAHALVAHYDVWLRRFDAKVAVEKPTAESFFDVGFAEVPFPKEAAKAFRDSYERLRKELYDVHAA